MGDKKKLTILVDMDDVLEHFVDNWIIAINEKYGRDVDPNKLTTWEILHLYPGLTVLDLEEILTSEEFWKRVKPIDGAVETMKKLIDDGHDVYVATSSWYKTLIPKMDEVLFKYFDFLTWDKVIVARDKWMIKGDVVIDDGIHNLENRTDDSLKLLFTATHNKSYDAESHGIVRVNNWKEVYKEISKEVQIRTDFTPYSMLNRDGVCGLYDRFCDNCRGGTECPDKIYFT